jgi:hypothetical protein
MYGRIIYHGRLNASIKVSRQGLSAYFINDYSGTPYLQSIEISYSKSVNTEEDGPYEPTEYHMYADSLMYVDSLV